MQSQLASGSSSQTVQLLSLTLHTTNPEDVEFSVTAECANAWSGTILSTGDVQTQANVKLWVQVDGVPVQVSPSQGDEGTISFCSRSTQLGVSIPGGFLGLYEQTKTANGFNWSLPNVGAGTHNVAVFGRLDVFVSGVGTAYAGIGRRTLTAEPVHLTNDATCKGPPRLPSETLRMAPARMRRDDPFVDDVACQAGDIVNAEFVHELLPVLLYRLDADA
jgi:hypothetical protein